MIVPGDLVVCDCLSCREGKKGHHTHDGPFIVLQLVLSNQYKLYCKTGETLTSEGPEFRVILSLADAQG